LEDAKQTDIQALILKLDSLLGARPQAGVVETLGEARRVEAIPYFIRALEDDACRSAAEEALSKLGSHARAALVETALARAPSAQEEPLASLRRRRSALELLAKMLLPRHIWRVLRPCLEENDPGIVTAVTRIALKPGCGSLDDKRFAVHRLLTLLSSADSSAQEQIENCLVGHYKDVRTYLEEEFVQRHRAWNPKNGANPMVPMLLRISRLADEKFSKKREE